MSYEQRQALITQIEAVRQSRVICHVLSDRETFPAGIPGFTAVMGSEPQPLLAELLREIGHVEKLDLFLMTRGGATEAVWPLVNLLRAHCNVLSVLVPFRAHSAGTLLCLGADQIVMSDMAELSPIDPTTGNQFNPRDPANPGAQFGISVEDVTAYFELARDRGGIEGETQRLEVFKQLASNVHPLALGNVQRVYLMIRRLAAELLALHLERDDAAFDRIITVLTTTFYTHLHAISRREAIELLGGWVHAPSELEAEAMHALFDQYCSDLSLLERYNLPMVIGDQPTMDVHVIGATLETRERSYVCTVDIRVGQRPNLPPGVQVQLPPGQALPLAPWVGRSYDWGVQRLGWVPNNGGE